MAIDYGFRRIGVAVGESEFGVVTPRPPMAATGTLASDAGAIAAAARGEEASIVVLGLPLEGGSEGRMARIVRSLAQRLGELGIEVRLVDESLTSVEADAALRRHDMKASRRRRLRDGEAAARILERYMDEQPSE